MVLTSPAVVQRAAENRAAQQRQQPSGGFSSITGANVIVTPSGTILRGLNVSVPAGTRIEQLTRGSGGGAAPPSRIQPTASFERPEVLEQARQQRETSRISARAAETPAQAQPSKRESRIPTVDELNRLGRNIEAGQKVIEQKSKQLETIRRRIRPEDENTIKAFESRYVGVIGTEQEGFGGFVKGGKQVNVTQADLAAQEKDFPKYQEALERYNKAVEEYNKELEQLAPTLNLFNQVVAKYESMAKTLEAKGEITISEKPLPRQTISEETKAALTATTAQPLFKLEKPKVVEAKEPLSEIGLGFTRAAVVPFGYLGYTALETGTKGISDINREVAGILGESATRKVVELKRAFEDTSKRTIAQKLLSKKPLADIEKLKIQTGRRAAEEVGDVASFFLPIAGEVRILGETFKEIKAGRTRNVLELAGTGLFFEAAFRGIPKVGRVFGQVKGLGAGTGQFIEKTTRIGGKAFGIGLAGVITAEQAKAFAETAYLPEKEFQRVSRQRATEFGLFAGYAGAFGKGLTAFEKMQARQYSRTTPAKVTYEAFGKTRGDIGEVFESKTRINLLTGKMETPLGEREFMATLRLADVESQLKKPKKLEEGITILKPLGKGKGFLETKFAQAELLEPFEAKITKKITADILAGKGIVIGEPAKAIKVSLKEAPFAFDYFGKKRKPIYEPSREAQDIYEKLREEKIIRTIGKGKLFEAELGKDFAAGIKAGEALMAEFNLGKRQPKVTPKRMLSLEFGETTGIKVLDVEVFKTTTQARPTAKGIELIQFPQMREIFRRRGGAVSIREEAIGGKIEPSEPIAKYLQKGAVFTKRGKKTGILVIGKDIVTKTDIRLFRKDIGKVLVSGRTDIDFIGRIKDSTTDVLSALHGKRGKKPMKPFKFEETAQETAAGKGTVQLQKAIQKAEKKLSKAEEKKAEKATEVALQKMAAENITIAQAIGRKAKETFAEELAYEFFAPASFKGVKFFGGFGQRPLLQEKNAINEAAKRIEKNISRPIPKEIAKELIKPIQKDISKPITRLFPKELLKPLPKEIPKEISKEIAKELIKPLPKLIPKEITKPIGKPVPKIIPPIIPKTPLGAFFKIEFPKQNGRIGREQGYNVFVKEEPFKRSRFIKVNKSPLPFESAKARGQYVVDQTIAQTAEPRKTTGKVKAGERQLFGLDYKFYSPKKQPNRFIEKRGYAIDTGGEVRKLQVSRFLAEERKGSNPFDLFPSKGKKKKGKKRWAF